MTEGISAAVGPGQPNREDDVRAIQMLLNTCLPPVPPLLEDGDFGALTRKAIEAFQKNVMHIAPDGVVGANGPTIRRLLALAATPAEPAARPDAPAPARVGLTDAEYRKAATALACEVAAIKAVAQTETMRSAFDEQGRPTILFERHKFHAFTDGRFDATHPGISNASGGGYGKFSAQYGRLEQAMALDREAALKSASWGAFQIMGFNHEAAGFATVGAFVDAMKASESNHLHAFVAFILNDAGLLAAIRQKDWTKFARRYNGAGFAANHYDTKMKDNYDRFKTS